jgi:hypothetical protein
MDTGHRCRNRGGDQMRKVLGIVVVMVVAWGASAASRDIDARMRSVENGLLPSVLIEGGPVWTIEERMAHYSVPGLAIAVIHDFQVDWVEGYGVIERGTGEPVTTETLFQAASISKPVGAVVALYLVEGGELDLDSDVNDRLRSWRIPENEFTTDEKVTLRRILTHKGGSDGPWFPGV